MRPAPPDQAALFEVADVAADERARADIRTRLDATLFVEAGAGSGKTSALVDRVVALVRAGTDLGAIAAITFTEKAATELRDRIRRGLEGELAAPPDRAARAARALTQLDTAPIGTLHAFAQRLLTEHPVEAGLPPRIEVLDEISSQVAFDDRWTEFQERLLGDTSLWPTLLLADAVGALTHLRALALQFGANWDLVAERVPQDAAEPPPLDLGAVLDAASWLTEAAAGCTDPDDKLLAELGPVAVWSARLVAAPDDPARLRLLGVAPRVRRNVGRAGAWADPDKPAVLDGATRLAEAVTAARAAVTDQVLHRLAAALAGFTLEAAEARVAEGTLEFHDLLVRARRLLSDPEHGIEVRRSVRRRYQHLLLDEFQDTDPIQLDVAELIATDPDATAPAADAGRLFFVGDAKQSIYRFRRADIGTFLAARDRYLTGARRLSRNFRSTRPVIEWINHVFVDLIRPEPRSQPEYQPLDAVRGPAPVGPAVTLLGADALPGRQAAATLRAAEAAAVAATVATAVADGWSVADPTPDGDRWRPCRLGDICILLPARTSLPDLERALEAAGIPYRAEASSLVYATREIRDLFQVLRAVDDPTDGLALASALRSPLFGCGDDDLATYRLVHRGSWNHQARLPEDLPPDHPVGVALTRLAGWHEASRWVAPSVLLERIVDECRLLELGFAGGRARDLWRRVRFVVDQARAFSDARNGDLRQFLAWAAQQTAEGARVSETVLPETDDDAVRVMTVHAAKGLEFPVAIVSGLTTQVQGRRGGARVVFPPEGGFGIRVGKGVQTTEYERFVPLDEQLEHHERLRLLYVASTRARDHLVVSTYRSERANGLPDPERCSLAELLHRAAIGGDHAVADRTGPVPAGRVAPPTAPLAPPPPPPERWRAERDAALAHAARPRVLAATTLARRVHEAAEADPGLAKEPRDLELPPWQKGRYGTAVGRAVHGVLQSVDLATGAGLEAAAAAQAAAESIAAQAPVVARLAAAALAHPVVQEAAAHPHWRELYVAAPLAADGQGVTVEGYVDLLYRGPDGLVVVDYKTDAAPDDAARAAKLARYRPQGATYALALETHLGTPVARCVFLFLAEDGATAVDLPDLPAAVAEARELAGAAGIAAAGSGA